MSLGHEGSGLTLGPVTGELIAEYILKEDRLPQLLTGRLDLLPATRLAQLSVEA